MRFEWDQEKCDENIRLRNLDFRHATPFFSDPERLIWEDLRRHYGERRVNMLAKYDGRVHALTFTYRTDVIRIISFRKANPREQRKYEQHRFN